MEDNILVREDIIENVIAIKVNQAYRENMTELELYEATRGYWKIDVKRAEKAEYVFSVYKGIIHGSNMDSVEMGFIDQTIPIFL